MVSHIDVFKSWAATIRQDTDALKALLESTTADACSRRLQAVRGRTPTQLVDDAAVRTAFYVEVDVEIERTVPIVIQEPTDAELRLKAYLTHKLR